MRWLASDFVFLMSEGRVSTTFLPVLPVAPTMRIVGAIVLRWVSLVELGRYWTRRDREAVMVGWCDDDKKDLPSVRNIYSTQIMLPTVTRKATCLLYNPEVTSMVNKIVEVWRKWYGRIFGGRIPCCGQERKSRTLGRCLYPRRHPGLFGLHLPGRPASRLTGEGHDEVQRWKLENS